MQPIQVGKIADFEVNEPRLIAVEGLPQHYIVWQASGEYRAFLAKDTFRGCTLPWRPSLSYGGREGWFRDPCHGSTYDLDGTCVYGFCYRDLDQLEVEVKHERVYVIPGSIIEGAPATKAVRPVPRELPLQPGP